MRMAGNSSSKASRFTTKVKLKAVLDVMSASDGESEATRRVAGEMGVKPGTLAGWVLQVEARMDWLFEKSDPPELFKALIQRGRIAEVKWAIRKACDRILGPPCKEQPDDLDMEGIIREAKSICPRVKVDISERRVLAELMGNGGDLPSLPVRDPIQTIIRPRGPKVKVSDEDLYRDVEQMFTTSGGDIGYRKAHERLRQKGVKADKERVREIVNSLKGTPTKIRQKKKPSGEDVESVEGDDLLQSLTPAGPLKKRRVWKLE